MKKITKNAVIIAATILFGTLSVNAQWRWNPNDWETVHTLQGATTSVSTDNKTFIVSPYAHSTTDLTARRGDIRIKKDVKLLETEPIVAVYMKFNNITMSMNDWKFDYIIEQQTALAYDETTLAYTWGLSDFKFGGVKYKVSSITGVSAMCYTSDGANDLWIFDMTASTSNSFVAEWLGNGDRNVPYYPTWTIQGVGVGAKQVRSWLGFVCIGTGATTNPTYNLKYCATAPAVNDVLVNIENYLNGDGGQEVREGDETSVKTAKYNKAIIYSGEGHVISPNAVMMEAYSVCGTKIKEVKNNKIDLNAGIYLIKVINDQGDITLGKAIVR